jgi:hypothetical protein
MDVFKRLQGRVLLILLTIWAIVMVAPDFYRLLRPLASFGFYANGDGLITDVRGPFADELASPAYRAGMREGDRLDLGRMRCLPVDTLRCGTALTALGGVRLVGDRREGEVWLTAAGDKPSRKVEVVAETPPFSGWAAAVLPLDQLAALLVILAAAWLVWTRPGGMTWGFFLFVLWFNPGQSYEYYALLQYSPKTLLTQNFAGYVAQGAGFAGFLLFAMRAPRDQCSPRWQTIERALPTVGVLLGVLLALSSANVFGYPAEIVTRAGILSGLLVAACAFAILLARRGEQPPADYQRLRWVIWGCLIGLPSLSLADLAQQTTLLADVWGNNPLADEAWDFVRLINGVLCLFVFEAVRRPLVVSVAIPLRRVTILGLLLSAPTLFLHQQAEHVNEWLRESLTLPGWVWVVLASIVLFALSRLHELAVHRADRYFNRAFAQAGEDLGKAILQARDFATIETHLVGGVQKTLGLASASIFLEEGAAFRRGAIAGGWNEQGIETLEPDEHLQRGLDARGPFAIKSNVAKRNHLPDGPMRPVLGLPIGTRFDIYALALYGAHAAGNDLNHDERATLAMIGKLAGEVWTRLDHELLRQRIALLESQLQSTESNLTATPNASAT